VSPAEPPTEGVQGDTIRRNTALSLVALVGPALLTFGLTIYLVRALGPDSYGVFALAMAIGLLLLLPSDLGLSQSAARYIAEHRSDTGRVSGVLSDALRLKLLGGLVVSVALLLLAGPIASAYDEPALVWPLRGMALAVFAQGMMAYWNTAFVALRRVSLNLKVVLSESVAEVTASVALVALGAGATGAAFGRAFGFGFGALMALLLLYRLLGRNAIAVRGRSQGHVGRIARYAGALVVIDIAYSALMSVDALVIGAMLEAKDVGLFQAPYRIVYALAILGLAFANGVAPRMSRTEPGPDVGAFVAATRYLLVLQTALAVTIAVWAEPIVDLVLGADYEDSVDVLRVLAVFVFVAGLSPLFSVSVNYLGEARRRIPIAVTAVLLNLVVDVVLIREIGIVGAAIGSSLAMTFYAGAHFWLCHRVVGLPLRQLVVTLARALVAGAAMAGVLAAFAAWSVGVPALVLAGLAACAVFVGALVVLGELSRAELAAGLAVVAGAARRIRS
jgi:O-antigen/teichoic acid export membrane protein